MSAAGGLISDDIEQVVSGQENGAGG